MYLWAEFTYQLSYRTPVHLIASDLAHHHILRPSNDEPKVQNPKGETFFKNQDWLSSGCTCRLCTVDILKPCIILCDQTTHPRFITLWNEATDFIKATHVNIRVCLFTGLDYWTYWSCCKCLVSWRTENNYGLCVAKHTYSIQLLHQFCFLTCSIIFLGVHGVRRS